MGIPLYFKIISEKYPEIIRDDINSKESLFLDLNCAIHPCCRKVMEECGNIDSERLEKRMINEVLLYIEKLFLLVNPKLLFIAIDGVAPCAKMNQQRLRRYKTILDKNNLDKIKLEENIETNVSWNTNAISPGTEFMSKLSKSIKHELSKNECYKGVDILSHSDSHAAHWGGSLDNACRELSISKQKLEKLLNKSISYAISPFHHTPDYIFEALSKSGYKGCVGGTVKQYQNNICARGITIEPTDVTFHCQQVMLHGDCILRDGDPLRVYKQSFSKALHSESIFGYLDHPFSSRYQYGWQSEEQRLEKHSEFINYINKKCPKVLWSDETNTLDYIAWLNKIDISEDDCNYIIEPPLLDPTRRAAINYKNKKYPLSTKSISIKK